jgi:hypothetical protein
MVGEPEAITRLLRGVSGYVPQALMHLKISEDEDAAIALGQEIAAQVNAQLVAPAMPIKDAIDLAEFLCRSRSDLCDSYRGILLWVVQSRLRL